MSMASSDRPLGDAARWISARARNALRRPVPILVGGGLVFAGVIAAFFVLPLQLNRVARSIAPRPEERPDTVAIAAELARAVTALSAAEAELTRARLAALRPPPLTLQDTLSPTAVARRDSLSRLAATLRPLIERAETAPLPASFRAIAEHPAMQSLTRARALVDSLTEVERQREVFGAAGGVDPIYVALTSRTTALGRSIHALAGEQLASIDSAIRSLRPPPPPAAPERPTVDTLSFLERRAIASVSVDSARARLERARATNRRLDLRAEQARRLATTGTPIAAVAGAALVLGLAAGYALALMLELHRPRVADAREVERLTGVRVLGIVVPHAPPPDRLRRRADQVAPPLILTTDETYRRLYLHLSASAATIPLVTFTGEDPAISGVVGANVAAMAVLDARSTLLVEADLDHTTLSGVLGVPVAPGLAEILSGAVDWAEAVVPVTIGRDRTIFVVPSGGGGAPALTDELRRTLRDDLERMARRYDMVIVVSSHPPTAHVGIDLLPVPDVVYCAEVGRASLAHLMRAVRELQETGARVRGIVLWNREVPDLPSRAELTGSRAHERRIPAEPPRATHAG